MVRARKHDTKIEENCLFIRHRPGTNAETFLLTREERKSLLQTARAAVPPNYPIMAGVSGHSTAQVLQFIADAYDAGANYTLLLPPAYFGAASTPVVVERFFDQVAEKSQLPIVIYNFPGVCNGVDIDSDMITRLAKRWPGKIVGVKLTCGSVAKITRLSASLPAEQFSTFGGQSDFLIGGLAVGSAGCIAGFGNVFPKSLSRIYTLYKEGRYEEALKLHRIAALAEVPCKAGIASVKFAASKYTAPKAGLVGDGVEQKFWPRHPYSPVTEEVKKRVETVMVELAAIEESL